MLRKRNTLVGGRIASMKTIRITPIPKHTVDTDELVGALIDLARQLVAEQKAPVQPPARLGVEDQRSA